MASGGLGGMETIESSARKERKAGRQKTISKAQEEFIHECKRKVEAMSLEECRAQFDRKPDGTISWIQRPTFTAGSSPSALHVRGVGVWWPEKMFAEMKMRIPCPSCTAKGTKFNTIEGNRGHWSLSCMREVLGANSSWYLLSRTYRCAKCGNSFRNTRSDVLRFFPHSVRLHFGVILRRKVAMERSVCISLYSQWMLSPPWALSSFREAHIRHFEELKALYLAGDSYIVNEPEEDAFDGADLRVDPEILKFAELAGLETRTPEEQAREDEADYLLSLTLEECLPHLKYIGKDKLRHFNKKMNIYYVFELVHEVDTDAPPEKLREWANDPQQKPSRLRSKIKRWKYIANEFLRPHMEKAGVKSIEEALALRQRMADRSLRNLTKIKQAEEQGLLGDPALINQETNGKDTAPTDPNDSTEHAPSGAIDSTSLPANTTSRAPLNSSPMNLDHHSIEEADGGISSVQPVQASSQGNPDLFGEFDSPNGYNGFLIGRKFLDDLCIKYLQQLEPGLKDIDNQRAAQSSFSYDQTKLLQSLNKKLVDYEDPSDESGGGGSDDDGEDQTLSMNNLSSGVLQTPGMHHDNRVATSSPDATTNHDIPLPPDAEDDPEVDNTTKLTTLELLKRIYAPLSISKGSRPPLALTSELELADSHARQDYSAMYSPDPAMDDQPTSTIDPHLQGSSAHIQTDSPTTQQQIQQEHENSTDQVLPLADAVTVSYAESWRTIENLNPRKYCQGCHRPRVGHMHLAKQLMPGKDSPAGPECILPKVKPNISRLPISHFFSGDAYRAAQVKRISGRDDSLGRFAKRARGPKPAVAAAMNTSNSDTAPPEHN